MLLGVRKVFLVRWESISENIHNIPWLVHVIIVLCIDADKMYWSKIETVKHVFVLICFIFFWHGEPSLVVTKVTIRS